VEATFRDSRNSVISKRIDGKADSSNGRATYILASRITRAIVILKDSSKSSIMVGSGTTMNTRIPTTATAI